MFRTQNGSTCANVRTHLLDFAKTTALSKSTTRESHEPSQSIAKSLAAIVSHLQYQTSQTAIHKTLVSNHFLLIQFDGISMLL